MNLLAGLARIIPASLLMRASRRVFQRPGWKNQWLSRVVDGVARRLSIVDGTIIAGAGKGLRFNVGGSRASFLLGTSKPEVQELMAAFIRSGMTVYDIGANVGYQACIAARLVGPTGRVICFEPLPANADRIEHNREMNAFANMVVRREALGNENGIRPFQVSAKSTFGALVSAKATIETPTEEIDVRVRRLDSVVSEEKLSPPDWIKIDVEGGEMDALLGARTVINDARPILVIELHGTNRPIAELLRELNYFTASVESAAAIETGHWNANIIAIPAEKADLVTAASAALNRLYAVRRASV